MIYLFDVPVNTTHFPDKTSQVWKIEGLDKMKKAQIRWDFENEGEFIQLAQLKTLIDSYGIASYLKITFLPYARQDKNVSNETTFALQTFATLLNSLKFKEITILDPHSEKAIDLIHNSVAVFPKKRIENLISALGVDLICYPDAGAVAKYRPRYEFAIGSIYGEKNRNQSTGEITGYSVVGNPAGKNVLIVDDICDGGATFKILARDLLDMGAKSVCLFVTHGIFSKGTKELFESGISRIFTNQNEKPQKA